MVRGRVGSCAALIALLVGVGVLLLPARTEAQKTVLVEGNNATDAGIGATKAAPGTAGDYDGDTRVGAAEDTDGNDGIFGTINGALGAANGGIDTNGRILIVASGRFPEQINLTGIKGNVVIEGAPGVSATIDAVIGSDAGNAARLAGTGILVDTDTNDRSVILRNLTIRNFNVGLLLRNRAHVVLENVRFDSSLSAGVVMQDRTQLTMDGSSVIAGGQRFSPAKGTPSPGDGIVLSGDARATISRTTIAYNEGAGIRNNALRHVRLVPGNNITDNGEDIAGTGGIETSPF